MVRAILKAESLIALTMMGLAVYFMIHAAKLPIGWSEMSGPGAGAFPFWLSLVMFGTCATVLARSVRGEVGTDGPFFEPGMFTPVAKVVAALAITIALMPVAGAYIALPLFIVWYVRFLGRNGWLLTGILAFATPVAVFFFFEVALRILLPKGFTEPLFFPLYAIFF